MMISLYKNRKIELSMKRLNLKWSLLLAILPAMSWAVEERPVSLEIPAGEIKGKMLLPDVETPPVVLIIAGSGPTDMDGNTVLGAVTIKNNSLKFLAEGLAERGIASLRYDKRGIASSAAAGQVEADLRFDDYVADARAWIDSLAQEKARFSGVYVLGHSEGALIGMLASAGNEQVKGVISLAGAGRPAYEIIERQMSGQPAAVCQLVKSVNDSLRAGKTVTDIPVELMALYRLSVQPYLISWYRYNPQTVVAGLEQPVLIVQGDKDIQVSVEDAQLLKKAQPRATIELVENMNHVLKRCESTEVNEQQSTYANPDLPVMKNLLDVIDKFIKP